MLLSVNEALEIIRHHRRVAVVGLSPNQNRPSHKVAEFLIEKGFDILPVNPGHQTILGKPCVDGLADLEPEQVDWIDLFVSSQRLADLANDIIRLSPMLVWCQIGVVNEAFNRRMQNAQIPYIIDVCPKIEWQDTP
jgi:uncharacterized protein